MRCVNVGLLKTFKATLILIGIVVVTLLIVINVNFDMTGSKGYLGVLGILSPIAKDIKGSRKGPIVQGNVSFSNLKVQRTLLDPPELRSEPSDSNKLPGNIQANAAQKSILWFNKPVWIDVYHANNILTTWCPHRNCRMYDTDILGISNYSAIIYTLTSPLVNTSEAPVTGSNRNTDQVWIFMGLESPLHTSRLWYRHHSWANSMNWSMSYRMDADIFFPYGILVARETPLTRDYGAMYRHKTKHIAWAVSNCGAPSRRDEYVEEMKAAHLLQVKYQPFVFSHTL